MILIVGATGQLGSAIVRRLAERGKPTVALARSTSNRLLLDRLGIETVIGDLRDPSSLDAACRGVRTIIATANAAVPSRREDTFESVDGVGYQNLIRAAKQNGVRHFIYTSALSDPGFDRLPIGQQKRLTEKRLMESGIDYTIFRAEAFMDISFPMMGSEIPVRGTDAPTVERPFWFTSKFFSGVKDGIAKNGVVGISGDGTSRHSYICVDDVADFHVAAIDNPAARNKIFDIGGPEALSQNDILAIFEKVTGRKLKTKHTPAAVFKIGSLVLRPFSVAAANIMGINYHSTVNSTEVDTTETAKLFGVRLTSAEEFLVRKANL
ncbi:MAG TPA: NmrA family NAD(P)-binding protein [Pyrinomonadaceae bacterium]